MSPWYAQKGWQVFGAGLLGVVVGAGGVTSALRGPAVERRPAAEQDVSGLPAALARAEAAERKLTEAEAALKAVEDVAPEVVQEPAEEEPVPAQEPGVMADKSFIVDSVRIGGDALGDFSGSARIKNDANEERSAVVTFTVFDGGEAVGVLSGSVQEVSPGQVVTVQLVSTDPYVASATEYDFQVDLEF